MKTFMQLLKRNILIFFKDKGMFLVSLITPVILLILYATFLGNVFRSAFTEVIKNLPGNMVPDSKLIEGLVAGQLTSSILATCCVTIAFCANTVMIQDKYNGAIKDINVTPVKKSTLALSYFFASLFATLIICLSTTVLCLGYVAIKGWYLTFLDVVYIILDVILLSLFGTALSSIIHHFLSSEGQASGVGTLVSSLYGFICGAYMPMSQFPSGLRSVLSFLPGTYGTVLLRNHCMATAISKLKFPANEIEGIRDTMDCNIKLLDNNVTIPGMYAILGGTVIVLITVYVLLHYLKKKKK